MRDMNDYIHAYSEMGPLLDTYDRHLQRIIDLYNEAQKRDKSRLRVDRFYRKRHLTNWENMSEILDITHWLGKIMQQERSVVKNMAQLPDSERMQFWHEHYLPLEAQEKGLRAKLLVVGQRMTPAEQQSCFVVGLHRPRKRSRDRNNNGALSSERHRRFIE